MMKIGSAFNNKRKLANFINVTTVQREEARIADYLSILLFFLFRKVAVNKFQEHPDENGREGKSPVSLLEDRKSAS